MAWQVLRAEWDRRASSDQWDRLDPLALPAIDELVAANFPPTTSKLDISGSSGAVSLVTNRTTITSLSANPPLKLIRVESAWTLNARAAFTNSVSTYRSP